MIYIAAMTYQHASYHACEMNLTPREWRYVNSTQVLRGTHQPRVILCHTFFEMRDAHFIRNVMTHVGAEIEHVQTWDPRC